MFTWNGCIAVVAGETIAVYAIPALQPRLHDEKPDEIPHEPMYEHPLQHGQDVADSHYLSDPWCEQTSPDTISKHLDIIHEKNGAGTGCIIDYHVVHPIDVPGSPLPPAFPVHKGVFHIPDFQVREDQKLVWLSPQSPLLLARAKKFLSAWFCRIPDTRDEGVAKYQSVRLWNTADEHFMFEYWLFGTLDYHHCLAWCGDKGDRLSALTSVIWILVDNVVF